MRRWWLDHTQVTVSAVRDHRNVSSGDRTADGPEIKRRRIHFAGARGARGALLRRRRASADSLRASVGTGACAGGVESIRVSVGSGRGPPRNMSRGAAEPPGQKERGDFRPPKYAARRRAQLVCMPSGHW
jgi:hypothetical protein